jgi:hypothetical protein
MPEDGNDWTSKEAEALRGLGPGAVPPADLEGRTVERLRRAGLLRGDRSPAARRWLAVAAGVALFAAGIFAGSRGARPSSPSPAMPGFVLLLYDPTPSPPELAPAEELERAKEYGSWARGLRREGVQIRGERLEPESRWLGLKPSGAGGLVLGGYFVVSARNYAAAVAVARTCPHLKHGGTIEVRPIGST